ncbi:MAG: ABC transporter permease [Firmicutes bacterium]|nr:ABC transporter permease [Bacillota bacterium]
MFILLGLKLEIKKHAAAYLQLLICLLAALLAGVFVLAAAMSILDRKSPFADFTVGVVNNDGALETKMLLDSLRKKAANLREIPEADALAALKNGAIPAYIVIPTGFADDVKSGVNTPFLLYGNPSLPIQWKLTQILAQGGVAYLSASQAGIYATMDCASARGMAWEDVVANLLYPVNAAFIKYMLDDSRLYRFAALTTTDGFPVAVFYGMNFAAFFALLSLQVFIKPVRERDEARARYAAAGIPPAAARGLGVAAMWLGLCAALLPLFFITGWKTALMAFCLAAYADFMATAIKNRGACAFTMFALAAVMLYLSGGVVPPAFLPEIYSKLQYATLTYWFVHAGDKLAAPVLAGAGAAMFGAGLALKKAL